MDKTRELYRQYFLAEDRFLNHPLIPGYEQDVIIDMTQAGMNLAAYYGQPTPVRNPLLQELFLRRVFFHLLNTIDNRHQSRIFRRICLDYLHCPLLALKKFYGDSHTDKFLSLKQNLLQLQHSSGL
ncbi:hypothetical protein L4174_018170 [Photobacterium sp. CCB-ST2H9]|uniref:hypothetical protein n=1 Tax=unclassified Photobacterium TaxID=2628852 RepID=UPI0020049D25|nr:hypothetical protein [Photobacterium sp. CCB-ST2H9]UTM59992.1 hypothetical protein L4174_018170 [Photobacterium sp. CCB-ST2H9]